MIRATLSTAVIAMLPVSALADSIPGDLDCKIVSSCTNDFDTGAMECEKAATLLHVRKLSGTKYSMGWADQGSITVYATPYDGFHLFEGRDAKDAVQTLVVADDLKASLSFAGVTEFFPTALFAFSSLICTAPKQ